MIKLSQSLDIQSLFEKRVTLVESTETFEIESDFDKDFNVLFESNQFSRRCFFN